MIFVVIALLHCMNSLTEWQQHDEHNTCICRQRDALFCRSLQVTTVLCSRSESTILQSYRSVVILNNTYTFTGLTALPQTFSWNGGRGKVAPEGGGERGAKGKGRGKGRMGDPQLNYAPGLPPAKSGPAVQSEVYGHFGSIGMHCRSVLGTLRQCIRSVSWFVITVSSRNEYLTNGKELAGPKRPLSPYDPLPKQCHCCETELSPA